MPTAFAVSILFPTDLFVISIPETLSLPLTS